MIDEYKDGVISKEDFCSVVEHFVSTNELEIPENSVLHSLLWSIIPDVCLFYVEEPGEESEKELNFWKGLKDIEYQLRYGYFYREKENYKCPSDIPKDQVLKQVNFQRQNV